MQEHSPTHRKKWRPSAFGCLVWTIVGAVAVILIARNPVTLGLRLAGFRTEGDTQNYLEARMSSPESDAPSLEWGEPLNQVEVDIWFLSQPRIFTADTVFAERLERGYIAEHKPAYVIEYDEAGLNEYLNYWFSGSWGSSPYFRDIWFDLKPDGLIVRGEIDTQIDWQPVGAVFQLDESQYQFDLVGVDVAGQLYSTPPSGRIAEELARLEADGNRALRELIFLDIEGDLLITQITLDEDRAIIVAE